MDLPKIKAIEVSLSDGTVIVIHEPKGREGLRVFLSSMPALTVLQRTFTQIQDISNGVEIYTATEIPSDVIDAVHNLFGVMTEITSEEFELLSVSNQLALLQGFSLFAPKKTLAPVPVPGAEPLTTPSMN